MGLPESGHISFLTYFLYYLMVYLLFILLLFFTLIYLFVKYGSSLLSAFDIRRLREGVAIVGCRTSNKKE
jgi:flagellar biogenesis protein FliO